MTDDEMIAFMKANGYRSIRKIGGLWCGTQDYVTTRSISIGVTVECPYERRYCYQNRAEADQAFAEYADTDTHPSGDWIKLKGIFRGEYVDGLNPNWHGLRPWDEVAPSDKEKPCR